MLLPAIAAASALVWTSFGAINVASGKERAVIIARAHSGALAPSATKTIYLLALGGDARKGNPTKTRMDAIQIVALDPIAKKASIVGIPRDAWVEAPGRGFSKITSVGVAGPEVMVRTVEKLSGCKFDYYTLTSFENFRILVDQFGGIGFTVKERIYEKGGSNIDLQAGRQTLDGKQALAWSRNRHNRPRGDFDRSFAQGELMIAALEEARADYAKDAGTALRNLGVLRRNLTLNIPLDEALHLGLIAMQVKPSDVSHIVVDGASATENGASIVRISPTGMNQLRDVCADGQLGN
ncbi:MAG: LCP family protein [Actinomycetota bacterium]